MTDTVPVVEPPQRKERMLTRRRKQAGLRKFLCGCIVLLLVGLTGICLYLHVTPWQLPSIMGMGADYLSGRIHHAPPFHGQQQVNILLLGADSNFVDDGSRRSDTIKFIRVDLVKPSLAILSIPRDTWVDIPGHGRGKINGAYQHGGDTEDKRIGLAKNVVAGLLSELTGQHILIDYYVRIQTGGFKDIVDALGGVEVNVEKKMDYDDNYQNLYIHLKPGVQVLNGTQAMGYVRFRHDAEGDYGRMRRQDQFIRAVAAKINRPEMKSQLPRLLGPIMKMMVTNLRPNDMLALKHVVGQIGLAGMYSVQLPTTPVTKGRASAVEVDDPDAAAQVVNEVLNGPRPTVMVLNGSGKPRLARDVRDQIDENVYNVVAVGTLPEPVPTTTVLATPHSKAVAQSLATQFGVVRVDINTAPPAGADFGKRIKVPPPAEITLVLGSDAAEQPKETAVSSTASTR